MMASCIVSVNQLSHMKQTINCTELLQHDAIPQQFRKKSPSSKHELDLPAPRNVSHQHHPSVPRPESERGAWDTSKQTWQLTGGRSFFSDHGFNRFLGGSSANVLSTSRDVFSNSTAFGKTKETQNISLFGETFRTKWKVAS